MEHDDTTWNKKEHELGIITQNMIMKHGLLAKSPGSPEMEKGTSGTSADSVKNS